MKTILAAILVMAASFNVLAQDAAADINPPASQQAVQWPMPV